MSAIWFLWLKTVKFKIGKIFLTKKYLAVDLTKDFSASRKFVKKQNKLFYFKKSTQRAQSGFCTSNPIELASKTAETLLPHPRL